MFQTSQSSIKLLYLEKLIFREKNLHASNVIRNIRNITTTNIKLSHNPISGIPSDNNLVEIIG